MRVEMMEYARESGVILSIELLFIYYSSHAITRRPLANTSARAGILLYDPPLPTRWPQPNNGDNDWSAQPSLPTTKPLERFSVAHGRWDDDRRGSR